LALASRIACRSDPAPESFVFVTVNVAAPAAAEARSAARTIGEVFIGNPLVERPREIGKGQARSP
jgi:hypothetical protein